MCVFGQFPGLEAVSLKSAASRPAHTPLTLTVGRLMGFLAIIVFSHYPNVSKRIMEDSMKTQYPLKSRIGFLITFLLLVISSACIPRTVETYVWISQGLDGETIYSLAIDPM